MAKIAHITFADGGVILPASTPYELEIAREHIRGLASTKRSLAILIDGKRWAVALVDTQCSMGDCATCRKPFNDLACQRRQFLGLMHCIVCALK